MRDSLTVLAILLIGVLTAALVGPYVIDWNSHRALIERRLSQAAGTPVTVGGAIDLKLLPTPRLHFGDVAIGDARAGRPRLTADALEAELSLTALTRGQVQFVDTTLVRPRLAIAQAADGAVDLALPIDAAADRVAVDHLGVRDGTVVFALADGRRETLSRLDFDGEATSLRGPFKAAGRVAGIPFRLATGAIDHGRLRVKLHVDGDALRPSLDLDGLAAARPPADRPGAAGPAFDGTATLVGRLPLDGTPAAIPWTLKGHVVADRDTATATDVELRAGADLRALIADGDGTAVFGASGATAAASGPEAVPTAALHLHGATLDGDSLAVAPDDSSIAPPKGLDLFRALSRVAGDGAGLVSLPMRLDLSAAFDTATLGGRTSLGTSAKLGLGPDPTAALAFTAEGPQGARLSLDGRVDPGPARSVAGPFGAVPAATPAVFRGRAALRSGDLHRTASWLSALSPELSAGLAALPARSVAASGDVEVSAAAVVARDLRLDVDGSAFAGLLSLTRSVGAERARLFADLTSDALVLDRVPDLAGARAAVRDLDLDLALAARAVTVADPGPGLASGRLGPIAAGHVALRLTKAGADLRLERLAMDVDGAAVDATASRTGRDARAAVHVSAPHLGPLAAALGGLLPPAGATILRTRAAVLSPLDATLTVAAASMGDDGALVPKNFALTGRAGGTRVEAALTPEQGSDAADPAARPVALSLTADAPDAGDLLRQFGAADPASGLGAAHIAGTGRGSVAAGFAVDVQGAVGGTGVSFAGQGRPDAAQGHFTLHAADLGPVLAGLGGGAAASAGSPGTVPADLTADIAWVDGRVEGHGIAARVAGVGVTGSLSFDLQPRRAVGGAALPQLGGVLSLDRLPASAVVALALGPAAAPAAGVPWSVEPFGVPVVVLPTSAVALTIADLPLWGTLAAHDLSLTLATRAGSVTLADAAGTLGAGRIGGSLSLRRDAGGGTLSGQVDWADVPLDAGGLSGRTSGRQDFAATGSSPAALVASLAGAGSLAIRGAALARTDPAAPGRTAALIAARDAAAERDADGTDATLADPEAIGRDLSLALDAGPLALGDGSVPTILAAGVLRAGPLRVSGTAPLPGGAAGARPLAWSAGATAAVDIGALTLATRVDLRGGGLGTGGDGDVLVTRSGPIRGEAPRAVDAAGLVSLVQAQALARAQDRVDILEQDIRERAAFNRQLKAGQQRAELEKQAAAARAAADAKARADAVRAAAEAQRAAEAERAAEARQRAEDARVQSQLKAVEPPSE